MRETAASFLGATLTTPQTGETGERVSRVYVEAACDAAQELFLGMVVDRGTSRVTLMASTEGGSEIEEVAVREPDGKPQRLAIMHGSSFEGDGVRALQDLAAAFRDVFGRP